MQLLNWANVWSIAPVVIPDFIIELLFELRMLFKVFLSGHGADLFLQFLNLSYFFLQTLGLLKRFPFCFFQFHQQSIKLRFVFRGDFVYILWDLYACQKCVKKEQSIRWNKIILEAKLIKTAEKWVKNPVGWLSGFNHSWFQCFWCFWTMIRGTHSAA